MLKSQLEAERIWIIGISTVFILILISAIITLAVTKENAYSKGFTEGENKSLEEIEFLEKSLSQSVLDLRDVREKLNKTELELNNQEECLECPEETQGEYKIFSFRPRYSQQDINIILITLSLIIPFTFVFNLISFTINLDKEATIWFLGISLIFLLSMGILMVALS
ncbi:hypothetical protein HNV12_01800 [Methanococcoides sp. SA1]|nr:hypothetical protein [Methanococcoides sp. SA1]